MVYFVTFIFQASYIWKKRGWFIYKYHNIINRSSGRVWNGINTSRWPQGKAYSWKLQADWLKRKFFHVLNQSVKLWEYWYPLKCSDEMLKLAIIIISFKNSSVTSIVIYLNPNNNSSVQTMWLTIIPEPANHSRNRLTFHKYWYHLFWKMFHCLGYWCRTQCQN